MAKLGMPDISDEEIKFLLEKKWIETIYDEILQLPNVMLDVFRKKIDKLAEKYADTYEDIENEIAKTEQSLTEMLEDLTGNEKDMAGVREFQKLLRGDF